MLKSLGVAPAEIESQLQQALSAADTLLDSLLGLLTSPRDKQAGLDDVAEQTRTESERRSLLGVAKSCLAIRDELAVAANLHRARSASFLIVRGPWGTGKTYHLARHALSLAEKGAPVLFVRARAFTEPDLPLLKQGWRRGLPCPDLSPRAFLILLNYLGNGQSGPTVLIVDGINEWVSPIWRQHLDELASQVNGSTHLRVIVTMRTDSRRPPDLPTYLHRSPERVVLAHSLNNVVGTPPGTLWSAALLNPMMARIAAKVAHAERARQPKPGTGRPLLATLSESRLVMNWVSPARRRVQCLGANSRVFGHSRPRHCLLHYKQRRVCSALRRAHLPSRRDTLGRGRSPGVSMRKRPARRSR